MGEATDNRDKFWKDQSLPIAIEILEKMQALHDNLEKTEACTPELYCWLCRINTEFSNISEL